MYHVIVSCEHAGNRIPKKYTPLFEGARTVLSSHQGFDIGGHILATRIAKILKAPLFATKVSRLLIDCNRSIQNPKLFSFYTQALSKQGKDEIIKKYYTPYRDKVESEIRKGIEAKKCVLHLSVHTFTPELDGYLRMVDVGVLYDPKRQQELLFSRQLLGELRGCLCKKSLLCMAIENACLYAQQLRVLANTPYKGISDGLTTYFRKCFPQENYMGIEIEVNQKFFNRHTH